MKADRHGRVPPPIVDLVTDIGREHELNAEALGRFTERSRLISDGRRDDEDAVRHAVKARRGGPRPAAVRRNSTKARRRRVPPAADDPVSARTAREPALTDAPAPRPPGTPKTVRRSPAD